MHRNNNVDFQQMLERYLINNLFNQLTVLTPFQSASEYVAKVK